jgi:hypothetical protein
VPSKSSARQPISAAMASRTTHKRHSLAARPGVVPQRLGGAVGQDPTDGYDGGRLSEIARRETAVSDLDGFAFTVVTDFKLKER